MIKLSNIRKPLKIEVQTPCNITRLGRIQNRYDIDWDVLLNNGKPLQRGFCWTSQQKSELILSILKKIRIPSFSFIIGGEDDRVLRVIDGKQRLSTLIDFYNGKIPFYFDGNEYYYCDLDKEGKMTFEYFDIMASVAYEPFKRENNNIICVPFKDVDIIEWFKLINFAGTPQNVEHLKYLDNVLDNDKT